MSWGTIIACSRRTLRVLPPCRLSHVEQTPAELPFKKPHSCGFQDPSHSARGACTDLTLRLRLSAAQPGACRYWAHGGLGGTGARLAAGGGGPRQTGPPWSLLLGQHLVARRRGDVHQRGAVAPRGLAAPASYQYRVSHVEVDMSHRCLAPACGCYRTLMGPISGKAVGNLWLPDRAADGLYQCNSTAIFTCNVRVSALIKYVRSYRAGHIISIQELI